MRIKAILAVISFLVIAAPAHAIQMIDFDSPLPGSLTPMHFLDFNAVPVDASITNQYSNMGIVFQNAALVDLTAGHAASGTNGIGGIDSNGNLSYHTPITLSFVAPADSARPAYTDYFALTTDNWGYSGNTITLSGFDRFNNLLGITSYTETGAGGITLVLQNIGNIHRIDILESGFTDGMALDNLTFNDVVIANPEPATLLLIGTGLVGLGYARRRRRFKS